MFTKESNEIPEPTSSSHKVHCEVYFLNYSRGQEHVTKKCLFLFSSKCKECVLVALRLPRLQLSLCIQYSVFLWFQSSECCDYFRFCLHFELKLVKSCILQSIVHMYSSNYASICIKICILFCLIIHSSSLKKHCLLLLCRFSVEPPLEATLAFIRHPCSLNQN